MQSCLKILSESALISVAEALPRATVRLPVQWLGPIWSICDASAVAVWTPGRGVCLRVQNPVFVALLCAIGDGSGRLAAKAEEYYHSTSPPGQESACGTRAGALGT